MTWRPGQPLALRTSNFLMRSLTLRDIDQRYQSWFHSKAVMEHFGGGMYQSLDQLRRLASSFDNATRLQLGIFCREDELFIGYYYIYVDYFRRVARTAVLIGDQNYWGKGVVIETRTVLLNFLFDRLNMERIWGWISVRNIPAIFNYKAQGFQYEGILRGHGNGIDGERIDLYVMGLLRDEWRAQRESAANNAERPSVK